MQNSLKDKRIKGFWYKNFSSTQTGEIYFTKDINGDPVFRGNGDKYTQIDIVDGLCGFVKIYHGQDVQPINVTKYKLCIKVTDFADVKIKIYRKSVYQGILATESFIIIPKYYAKDLSNPTNVINEEAVCFDIDNLDNSKYILILEKPDTRELKDFSA